jgi:hypothetical protein
MSYHNGKLIEDIYDLEREKIYILEIGAQGDLDGFVLKNGFLKDWDKYHKKYQDDPRKPPVTVLGKFLELKEKEKYQGYNATLFFYDLQELKIGTYENISELLYDLGQLQPNDSAYKETLIYSTGDLYETNECPIRVFEAREGSTKKRTKGTKKRSDSGSDESQDEDSSDEFLTKSLKRMRLVGGKKKRGTKKQR